VSKTTIVVCDACGHDLTETGNCEDYRVLLCSERIPSWDGIVTAMAAYPEFPHALHFCSRVCLMKHLTNPEPRKEKP
jgi:hypothetical protein